MNKEVSEIDIAKCVVNYLTEMKWEVYQEVQTIYGPRADIVAVRNGVLWVIECKKNLSLALINQAYFWLKYSNYVSVVSATYPGNFANYVFKRDGIGYMIAKDKKSRYNDDNICLMMLIQPNLRRKSDTNKIKSLLCEKQKTYALAGNSTCSYWSPFKQTCEIVCDYVRLNPGTTFKNMLQHIKTHYSSEKTAHSTLLHWIKTGVIKDIAIKRDGKALTLFLKDICADETPKLNRLLFDNIIEI